VQGGKCISSQKREKVEEGVKRGGKGGAMEKSGGWGRTIRKLVKGGRECARRRGGKKAELMK